MNHQRTHVSCHICGRQVGSQQQLKEHIQQCHQNLQLRCQDCDTPFTSSKLLAMHRLTCKPRPSTSTASVAIAAHNTVHDTDPQHQCPSCKKMYSRADVLIRHQLSIHKKLQCSLCPDTFLDVSSFKQHEKDKHTFTCDVCSRKFTKPLALKHHQRIHLTCRVCDFEATTKEELDQHIAERHQTAKKRKTAQVGRGKRVSLQDNAIEQTFTPTNNKDILMALKELEPTYFRSFERAY